MTQHFSFFWWTLPLILFSTTATYNINYVQLIEQQQSKCKANQIPLTWISLSVDHLSYYQVVTSCILHIHLFLMRSNFQALVASIELSTRRPGWWPGAIMSPSGSVTGLVESETYLSVLGSFGCQWTLAGCRSLLCKEAGGPSVMVEPICSASSFLHRKKKKDVHTQSGKFFSL